MALDDYRVIDYPEKTSVDNTDFMMIDSESSGTNKYQVQRIITEAEAKVAAAVAAEAEAREAADDALQDDIDTRATSAELAAETAAREAAVTELKADFNVKKILTADDFQQGAWSSSSAGAPTTNTTRICTKVLYPVYAGDKIEYTSSTLLMSFGVFSGNAGAVKNMEYHDWNTYATSTVFEISANGSLFINLRKSDNTTIIPSDYDASIALYQTVRNHADKGAIALAQSLRNLNAINAVSDGSTVVSLAMQSGKYINTSGAFVYNNNAALALSGLIPVDEKWITKVSFAVNGSASSVGYSVNFYKADYTWIGGTNNLIISADDFPIGTKYIVLMDYDTSSSHNGCAVTFFGFKRIDDLDSRIDALESANTVDSTVVNKDVFVDKTVIPNKNINYTTGAAETNNRFAACDFIAVEAGTAYHVMRNNNLLSGTGNVAFYDANKSYISGQQSIWSDWTTPSNCAYVRFSVYYGSYTSSTFSFDGVHIVKGTVASALNDLSAITTAQYSPLYGKKWIGIGDSLTEVNARADLRYWNYIVQPYGMTFTNMGVGGTGYINRQNESKAFYQRAEAMDTDADIITVMGGVNDCLFASASMGEPTDTGTTTWCGCVNALIDNIRSLYSYAPLGIISPLPCDWVDGNNETQYGTQLPSDTTCRMSMFVDKLKAICALRGVPFLDLFHTSGMMPNNTSFNEKYFSCGDARTGDGLHPNSAGHKLFYRKIEKFIETLLAE
jgi:lysophospholipase L1-like esterase